MRKFQAKVREWLGIDQLPTRNTLAALEAQMRTRHIATLSAINDCLKGSALLSESLKAIIQQQQDLYGKISAGALSRKTEHEELLGRLEQLMPRLAPANSPATFVPETYDWETVTAIALHQLENDAEGKKKAEELV